MPRLLLAMVLTAVAANPAMATEAGHHSVDFLGTIDNRDGTSTSTWAVTENGCDPDVQCNVMSHIAFEEFLCDPAELRWPDGTGEELFVTVTDAAECLDGTYSCLSTVYKPNLGPSPPDGPGDWIKFSTNTDEPMTVQLEPTFTHVFRITFDDHGRYAHDATVRAAIKSGTTVAIQPVPGSACLVDPAPLAAPTLPGWSAAVLVGLLLGLTLRNAS